MSDIHSSQSQIEDHDGSSNEKHNKSQTKAALNNDDTKTEPTKSKREICQRCQRPKPQACLCEALPEKRPEKSQHKHVKVVILQHPKEFKHKNRSVPILELCWSPEDLHLCIGRRLGDQIPDNIQTLLQPPNQPILVFPMSREEELQNQKAQEHGNQEKGTTVYQRRSLQQIKDEISKRKLQENSSGGNIVLLVLDATWKYAREMHKANLKDSHYPTHMWRLDIRPDDLPETFQPRRFDIRTTPHQNAESTTDSWMSTGECVAWLVSELEEDPSIYKTVLRPLDLMVQKWNSFITGGKKRRELQGKKKDNQTKKAKT